MHEPIRVEKLVKILRVKVKELITHFAEFWCRIGMYLSWFMGTICSISSTQLIGIFLP